MKSKLFSIRLVVCVIALSCTVVSSVSGNDITRNWVIHILCNDDSAALSNGGTNLLQNDADGIGTHDYPVCTTIKVGLNKLPNWTFKGPNCDGIVSCMADSIMFFREAYKIINQYDTFRIRAWIAASVTSDVNPNPNDPYYPDYGDQYQDDSDGDSNGGTEDATSGTLLGLYFKKGILTGIIVIFDGASNTTMAHEVGHLVGCGHNNESQDRIMNATDFGGDTVTQAEKTSYENF